MLNPIRKAQRPYERALRGVALFNAALGLGMLLGGLPAMTIGTLIPGLLLVLFNGFVMAVSVRG
jgi:hypothetical protein